MAHGEAFVIWEHRVEQVIPTTVSTTRRDSLSWILTSWPCTVEDQSGTDLENPDRTGGLTALYAL